MPHKSFIIILTCCLLGGAATAQDTGESIDGPIWGPPRVLQSDIAPNPTVKKPMIGSLRVANFEIVLGDTTMKQAQERFGGKFGGRGDAGDSLEWLCLRGADAFSSWVLWLESGEIDAGDIGALQLRRVAPGATFDERCTMLPGTNSVIKFPMPLNLGMLQTKVLKLMGQPSAKEGNALLYIESHEEILHKEPFTEYNAVTLVIRDGAVWVIEVQKSTTS
jgi:hypothetical protein